MLRVAPLHTLALCATLTVLAVVAPARANGRYPKADQLLVRSDDPSLLVARTTFGFLISRDAGGSWDWVCERAIGYSGIQDPTLGLMTDGTIIAGLAEGLARSSDAGCNWGFATAALNGSPVVDLTVPRDAPENALALVWDPADVSYSSRFLASDDDGRSFVPYGAPLDPSVLALTLDVAPSDATRVYASGTRTVDTVRSGLLFTSSDSGQHWAEFAVPFDSKVEQGVYIAAVDPNDPDTVYVRSNSATVSRLSVSHDAGQHFDVVYSGSLLAFALSADGTRLYFGGEDGLHSGLASDLEFEQRSTRRLLCLAATKDTLYACSDEHSGFTVGASHDDGFTFDPLLHLNTVRGPLACDNGATVAECAGDWPLVRSQLGIPEPQESDAGVDGGDTSNGGDTSDGGASDGESNAGAEPTEVPSTAAHDSSCAFGSSPRRRVAGAFFALALASAWLSRRYRSR